MSEPVLTHLDDRGNPRMVDVGDKEVTRRRAVAEGWITTSPETLAAITLEALGTLVIALLPIEFLDGRTIFRWSKLAWTGLYLLTLLVFLFVVVPLTDNWGVASAPIFGWGTLFVVFALVAVVTWALFRRKPRATTSSQAAAAPPRRSRR